VRIARDSRELLLRAAAGDDDAMDRLIRLHEPSLLAFVRASAGPDLRRSESVHDILQEILLDFARGLATVEYRSEAEFRGWLYTLAERRVKDRARHHRRQKRDTRHDCSLEEEAVRDSLLIEGYSALGGPAREVQRREDLHRLEALFMRLSAPDREVLSLAFFCGMSSAQIGAHLGLSEEVARKRRTRARTRLAALWAEESE
jgi:RNA polymerase sigma factor (sigma-70 family)